MHLHPISDSLSPVGAEHRRLESIEGVLQWIIHTFHFQDSVTTPTTFYEPVEGPDEETVSELVVAEGEMGKGWDRVRPGKGCREIPMAMVRKVLPKSCGRFCCHRIC